MLAAQTGVDSTLQALEAAVAAPHTVPGCLPLWLAFLTAYFPLQVRPPTHIRPSASCFTVCAFCKGMSNPVADWLFQDSVKDIVDKQEIGLSFLRLANRFEVRPFSLTRR